MLQVKNRLCVLQLELGSGLRRAFWDQDADLGTMCMEAMRDVERAFQSSKRIDELVRKGKKA